LIKNQNKRKRIIMNLLKNRTAVIVGGNGQIGRAVATRLASQGAKIIILTRSNIDQANLFATQLSNDNRGHCAIYADITDVSSIESAVTQILDCDILVNSAGCNPNIKPDNFDAMTTEIFDKTIAVNLTGVYSTIRTFASLLKASGDGLIVNITSAAGLRASSSTLPYGAAKAGVDLMTKSLARSLAPVVRVISIAPGYLAEGCSGSEPVSAEKLAWKISLTPMARVAEPDDVARAVEAYATTLNYATGDIVVLDGGRTL